MSKLIVFDNALGECDPMIVINPDLIESIVWITKYNGVADLLDKEYTTVTMRSGRQFRLDMPLIDVKAKVE